MSSLFTYLCIYAFGGLTFLPLTIGLLLLHAHFTLPRVISTSTKSSSAPGDVGDDSDDGINITSGAAAAAKRLQWDNEKDVAEGYFAVCREYVPGGVKGKPPVRTTPAGSAIAEQSPSVYQSMYRSLFERKQASSLDSSKSEGAKTLRRARNVFYVVLRHGHLLLYDDSEQVEVRHVIALAHHDVSIYGGGSEIPEGELWIKRNAIALRRKARTQDQGSITLPFFFFSENCSEKEDFYFALLRSQDRNSNEDTHPPQVQHFEVGDIISLVQRLHSSEEHLQTRWINALVGRLFLALYRTQTAEDFIRMKITKKIARVKKPAFLSGIILNKISLGTSAPFVTNPKLKDLTVEGEYCAEAHLKYEGNFRIEIAATARIDLGPRFKAREVNLVLAVVVKKLEGQLLVRLKPPPSNRIWIAFETMPQLDLSIEPIVSSRQITYNIILRAIESRIREVLAETIVLPHWDDSPFFDTAQEIFRGGIWAKENPAPSTDHPTAIPDDATEEDTDSRSLRDSSPTLRPLSEDRSASMPALNDAIPEQGITRRSHRTTNSLAESNDMSVSTGVQKAPEVPKVMRSKSFAAAADPVVNTNTVNSEANNPINTKFKSSKDAASFMTEISNRSQPNSPVSTPAAIASPGLLSLDEKDSEYRRYPASLAKEQGLESVSAPRSVFLPQKKQPSNGSVYPEKDFFPNNDGPGSQQSTKFQTVAKSFTPSEKKQQAVLAAAAAAKNWGWNTLNRKGKQSGHDPNGQRAGTPENPLGRGRPLPPPGQPLPLPGNRESASSLSLPKRKPVPSLMSPHNKGINGSRPPLAISREHSRQSSLAETEPPMEGLLIVEAPNDSESRSSTEDDQDVYGEFLSSVNNLNTEDGDGDSDDINQVQISNEEDAKILVGPNSVSTRGRSASNHISTYEEDEAQALASWSVAQEEEARSKGVWMDEQEYH
ncbi:hypothetical protein MMC10_009676 [Thelotrema lepadinum]|nr:hypothetical protein [Thelotrema lepadinum]